MASRSRRRVRPFVAVGAVILVAGVGASAAFALNSPDGHAYRTATVTSGAVAAQLHGTGIIQPVAQASVAFPISGTVTAVDVSVGSHVTAGQKLATLDATALERTVLTDQASLAAAQLKLYKALNGESDSSGSSGSGARPATTATTTAAVTSPTSGGSSSAIASAQQALLAAQKAVDAATAPVQTALQTASSACGASSGTTPSGPTHAPGTGRSAGATASTTTSTSVPAATKTPTTVGFGTAACLAAQQQLLTREQNLSAAQQSLARAEQDLERDLASSSNSGSSNRAASSGGSSANAAASSTSSAPSAAELVADQAAVDAAATQVLAAQETVEQATITSPVAGTVAAVGIQVGHQVTASSTTATIVVVGGGGYEISTTVSVNDIAKLKVGDAATVVPDATSESIVGKVSWIGAASGSSSSTTYPVVIGLTGSTAGLRNGAMASTSIELAHSQTSAITVPTSAVHTTNGFHTVTVLANGKASTVAVQVGVVGATATQITSGLKVGQVVVLADLHAAVPSSNTSSRIANAITGGTRSGLGG